MADFHALRHTFITNLAKGGVYPKVAQGLARHSTITLTMDRYTHQCAGYNAEALKALPDLSIPPAAQVAQADGTYDTPNSSPTSSSAKRHGVGATGRDESRENSQPTND